MKILALVSFILLSGCKLAERLSMVDEPPELSKIEDPTLLANYRPISMPMPETFPNQSPYGNSLWQTGSKAFFKDQRANKTGDIMTVMITLNQNQIMEMTPNLVPISVLNSTVTNIYGLQGLFPTKAGVANALSAVSQPNITGDAKYTVNDQINVTMAATVTQVLPNGSMVIDGRQEIGLVNEVREIYLTGIVRREDISASNTITMPKIAQLRIGYRGRGDLSDAMREPFGQRLLNKVGPF